MNAAAPPTAGLVHCQFCNATELMRFKKFTTPGIIVLIAGILLTPFCVGIVLIFAAFQMRETRFHCNACGREF